MIVNVDLIVPSIVPESLCFEANDSCIMIIISKNNSYHARRYWIRREGYDLLPHFLPVLFISQYAREMVCGEKKKRDYFFLNPSFEMDCNKRSSQKKKTLWHAIWNFFFHFSSLRLDVNPFNICLEWKTSLAIWICSTFTSKTSKLFHHQAWSIPNFKSLFGKFNKKFIHTCTKVKLQRACWLTLPSRVLHLSNKSFRLKEFSYTKRPVQQFSLTYGGILFSM